MKKLISLALVLIMTAALLVPAAHAAPAPRYTAEAETLYELGLFRGTGTNPDGTPIFALSSTATRMQALIMLIRLLGLEDEALATTAPNPFTDVDNASVGAKYAAYAYEVGLTKGIGNNKFGTTAATPAQYLTFVLRALGYDDGAGDFTVATAAKKAVEIGLLTQEQVPAGATLLRDDCALISHEALKTAMKGSDQLLAEKLIADGTLTEKAVGNSGILNRVVYLPVGADYRVKGADIAALFDQPVGWVDFSGTYTDDAVEKCRQSDWSAKALLLSSYAARQYCTGEIDTLRSPWNWKPSASDAWQTHGSSSHYDWLIVMDRDTHLIGYAVAPTYGYKDMQIPMTLCHMDFTEELEALRADCTAQYENAVEFGMDALRTESVKTISTTAAGNTLERIVRTLFIDREKLPESMRDFKYYALSEQRGDSKSEQIKWAWYSVQTDLLLESEDFTPLLTAGQTVPGRYFNNDNPDDIRDLVMLFDADRKLLGYCFVNGLPSDTETVIDNRT